MLSVLPSLSGAAISLAWLHLSIDDLPAHKVDARGREASVKVRSAASAAGLAAVSAAQTHQAS